MEGRGSENFNMNNHFFFCSVYLVKFFSPIIQRYLQCFGSKLLAMFEGPLGLDSIRGQGVGISVLEGGCLPAFAKGHIDPGAAQHSSPSSKSSLNSNFLALSGKIVRCRKVSSSEA